MLSWLCCVPTKREGSHVKMEYDTCKTVRLYNGCPKNSDLSKEITALKFPEDLCVELIKCTLSCSTLRNQSLDQEYTQESDAGSLWTPLKEALL